MNAADREERRQRRAALAERVLVGLATCSLRIHADEAASWAFRASEMLIDKLEEVEQQERSVDLAEGARA